MFKKLTLLSSFFAVIFAFAKGAYAQTPAVGMAEPWQLGFQEAVTPVMAQLSWLHDHFLLYIIAAITVFVLLLTLYIVLRYNRRANPVPSKTTHNTLVEVVWTVVPILILVAISIPSLRLHYFMDDEPEAEMVIKVVGRQWYWSYEYPDHGGFGYDSYMIKDEELRPGQPRLLEVDNRLVVPVDTVVKVQMTSSDVIHSWALPSFGVKRDAVPGRLNESWFKAEKTGVFYGQCSELCGVGHAYMPIAVEVVEKDAFANWVGDKREEAGMPREIEITEPDAADASLSSVNENEGPDDQNPAPEDMAKGEAKEADKSQPQTPAETTTPPAPIEKDDMKKESSSQDGKETPSATSAGE